MIFQKTLKRSVTINGIGIHSGIHSSITINPAPENTGIIFEKNDNSGKNLVAANYNNVVDTKLCTVIGKDNLKFSTIEHLMSALWGVGIDNARIECSDSEIVMMDGSSAPFVKIFQEIGCENQKARRKYLKVLKEIVFTAQDKFVKLTPSEETTYKCTVDYDHPVIGYQEATFNPINSNYEVDVSYARSFGFMEEFEALKKMGLALGGSLENAIGIDVNGVMNPEGLRYINEFARHKLLDLIGDLFLSGYRLIAKIEGYKCGHYLNNMVLRKLFGNRNNFQLIEL